MREWIDLVESIETEARLERARALGFDTSRVWYHGSPESFSEFSKEFVGKGTDQNGSGFYFTSDPEDAAYYATMTGSIMPLFLRRRGEVSRDNPIPAQQIAEIINAGDEEDLWNWGDIGTLGRDRVLRDAVAAYSRLPAFDAMIALSNDFFKGTEGNFIDVFSRITGCNHVMDSDSRPGDHCVMLDARDIRSVHARFEDGDSTNLLA